MKNNTKALHIELTEKCNLACPMCGRTNNKAIGNRELGYYDIYKRFSPDFIKQLEVITFCGNYGEPTLAKDIVPIIEHFKVNNFDLKIKIVSNGNTHNSRWWYDLAEHVDTVRFGIDGLQDTYKIYRVNGTYGRVLSNASAYINNGGKAIWDFIVFGHNEHQIEKAQSEARCSCFSDFVIKKTYRSFKDTGIKPPSARWTNDSLFKLKKIKREYGSIENYYNQTKIICKSELKKEVYLSAENIIYPCCWKAIKNDDTCAIKCGEELNFFEDQYK